MERNDANTGANDTNEISGSGSSQQDTKYDFSGSAGSTGPADQPNASGSDQSDGLRDRARNAIGTAGERLADVGSNLRDRAGTAKNKLADALESGADKLRKQDATMGDVAAPAADGRLTQVSDRVAGGMQASADWLREADITELKSGIERQVKEHPGRTLLIAVGLGYLVGRAFRGDRSA